MVYDSRSYEGRVSEQNIPVTIVEGLMNTVFSLLCEVDVNARMKIKSSQWNDFIISYHNLKNRTRNIVDDKEYDVDLNTNPIDACKKVRDYLYALQKKGMFKVGQDEVIL